MTWTMRARDEKKRVLMLVSRFDHCLVDLLYRWRSGELPMDIVAILANYPRETYEHIDFGDIPFHHLPVTRQTKMEQETRIWEIVRDAEADVVVLARYMQILSDGLAAKLQRALHQHPPLVPARLQGRQALPSGARARRQADRRDRAFRDLRSRRGSDHRAGRRADHAIATHPKTSCARAATSNAACSRALSRITSRTGC